MRGIKESLLLFLKGMGMGGADIVPGVSGGTVAFITGIYEELLNSIKNIDLEAFKLLFSFKLKEFWSKINGSFLLPLFIGILASVFSLAALMHYLLENHQIAVWSFFFGLIIVSSVLVLRETKKWNGAVIIAIVIGTIVAYFITEATPTTTTNDLWFVFVSGAIAICAMILPGISGAFILLLLGKYTYITGAISDFNILVLLVFALGCLAGLLSFARAVSWLLTNYHDLAIGLLSGFMLGSLNKVWPWKEIIAYRINSEGKQVPTFTENVMPGDFSGDPLLLQGLFFMALGIFIVVAIEKIAHYRSAH